jgi:hypothetical protein
MTFKELDGALPNGFHDAKLYSLEIDYVGGTATLRMQLDFSSPAGPSQEECRNGELRISGLYVCSIDPPDPKYPYMPRGSALNVSGDPVQPDKIPAFSELQPTLPSGVSCCRFFVYEWNSFISIAAKDVTISWRR